MIAMVRPHRRPRLLAPLVAGAALTSMLLAPSGARHTQVNASSVRPSTAPVTITIWDTQGGNVLIKQSLDATASAFMQTHPTVRIQYQEFEPDAYKIKLTLAVGAHHAPDIFMGWGGGVLQSYVDAGAVADLSAAFAADAAWRDRYQKSVLGPVTFNGRLYGVPYDATLPEVVVYNKAIFAQEHLTVPTAWPQLLQAIKTLQSHNIIPFTLGGKEIWPEMIVMQYLAERIGGHGALDDIAAHRRGASFNSSAWIQAATLAQGLVGAHAFENGFSSFSYGTGDATQLLLTKRAAMEFMGVWELATVKAKAPALVNDIGFFPVPAVPGGKGALSDIVGVPANYYSVSAASPHKAEAIAYLKQMLNEAQSRRLLAAGLLPPVRTLDLSAVHDPSLRAQIDLLDKSSIFQLALDQQLPPQLAQAFLDLTSSLFTQTITPQQFASRMQAKVVAYLAQHS